MNFTPHHPRTGAGEFPWRLPLRALALFALLATLAATGCKSSSGGAAGFASVLIPDRSEAEIRQMAVTVFIGNGYESLLPPGGGLVFEKHGSRANDIAYGGWIDDRTARVRVKAEIELQPDGSRRLQCQAYMVAHAGDSFFEEEHKLAHYKSGPYQKLLDETARRLK